jgi:hypothetical protein
MTEDFKDTYIHFLVGLGFKLRASSLQSCLRWAGLFAPLTWGKQPWECFAYQPCGRFMTLLRVRGPQCCLWGMGYSLTRLSFRSPDSTVHLWGLWSEPIAKSAKCAAASTLNGQRAFLFFYFKINLIFFFGDIRVWTQAGTLPLEPLHKPLLLSPALTLFLKLIDQSFGAGNGTPPISCTPGPKSLILKT